MIPNVFTRILVEYLTDRSGGYCIAEKLREAVKERGIVLDARRLKNAATMLLITDGECRALASPWKEILLAAVHTEHGVDWTYVSTALAADHAMN